jgi:heterogeneous nuclear ribonucleoprotein A0
MGDDSAPTYKVFVGGLTWDLTNEELQSEFNAYNASKAEILVDKMSGRSRGFGFVWFENRKDMEDAIKDKNKGSIKDREISVKEAIPESQIPPGGRQKDRYRGGGGGRGGYESRGYESRGYDRGGGYGYERERGGAYGGYGGYSGYPGYEGYGGGYGYDARGGYDSRSGYSGGYGSAYPGYSEASRSYGAGGSGGSYGPERGASRAAPRTDPYARR